MRRDAPVVVFALLAWLLLPPFVWGQAAFEEAVVDVGNLGLTMTNTGFIGRANVRNNPTGPPSFEYPLDSGVEHLFEAGLWIGALRSDGTVTVRTGAATASAGYRPGATGYELSPLAPFTRLSTLLESEVFTRRAVSHQDFISTYVDTASVLPGTSIPMPDPQGQLGAKIIQTNYSWNFPFTEYFTLVNFDIVNLSDAAWSDVYVGLYHDLVVRNINATNEAGSAFFNKNGIGFLDSLTTSYAFNAGGSEETVNTYGAVVFLGAEWREPRTGQKRFFHPDLVASYVADGYAPPQVSPRWWIFSGGLEELSRPATDIQKYLRMSTPFPNPPDFETEAEFLEATTVWRERLRTDGQRSLGNYIGLTPIGPFPSVEPGDTVTVTFAFVGALKPEEFQGPAGKPFDNEETRRFLHNNIIWARRTYSGEDNNFNGSLDLGEDVNGNGVLDRYLIPEPPVSPRVHIAFERSTDAQTGRPESKVLLYWDRSAERSIDPVTGERDFEGYRIYRSNPGDERTGNILDQASLIAQFDRTGNRTGFNNGFDEVRLPEPVIFADDTTQYWYRFDTGKLLAGWQYLFNITAFDEGDPDAGLESFESSRTANSARIFPGTPPADNEDLKVGVYPNPYRVNAAWDGGTNRTRKLNFYNVPARAQIRIYTLAGEIVATLDHEADTYTGDIRWYDNFSADNRFQPGGEHSWDVLSENNLNLAGGLYLFTVKNLDSGRIQRGKFVIIK